MKTLRSRSDAAFDTIIYAHLAVMAVAVLYPLYYVVISSFSDPNVAGGSAFLFPQELTFKGYHKIFADDTIWMGYRNSILYTTVGTLINVLLTLTAGYALSRQDLVGRHFFMFLIVFTMFFGGGLIPTYLLVKKLGMVDTMWAMVIPNAASAFNIVIARTFFQTTIPKPLLESASIDGCSNTRFFLRIAIPLSLPIVAVLTLFYAVGHWNSYFNALIYLKNAHLQPLQIVLRNVLVSNQVEQFVDSTIDLADQQKVLELMKFGIIVVASLPILVLYPFLQKYFVKGVMIGSIKE